MYWRTKTGLQQGVGLMDEADREGWDFLSELMMPVLIKYLSLFWFPTMK